MTEEIIVDERNMEKIEAAIEEAQGKARERRINAADVRSAYYVIEHELGIPKVALEGVSYSVDIYAQNFPRAYKHRAESMQFTLAFSKGSWRVSKITRAYTKNAGHRYECLALPEKAQAYIIASKKVF